MKELLILRHAKSNRIYRVEDIDRPLTEKGMERIKEVSQKQHLFFDKADVIISSPAIRALHTTMILIRELNFPIEKLIIDKNLYTFSADPIIDYVYGLNDQWNKVVLVGHNHAFTEVINHFSDTGIDHLSTAGLAKISFDGDLWSGIHKGELLFSQKTNNF